MNPPAQLLAYRVSEANMVKMPYLVITGDFLVCCAADFPDEAAGDS